MKCEICSKDINQRKEGYFSLSNIKYHSKKEYGYIDILKDDDEDVEQSVQKLVTEDNKIIYCEDCFNSYVQLRSK
jgi:hypothetical protein